MIFTLLVEDLATSPAALVRLTAFDCRGLPVVEPEARGTTRVTG